MLLFALSYTVFVCPNYGIILLSPFLFLSSSQAIRLCPVACHSVALGLRSMIISRAVPAHGNDGYTIVKRDLWYCRPLLSNDRVSCPFRGLLGN